MIWTDIQILCHMLQYHGVWKSITKEKLLLTARGIVLPVPNWWNKKSNIHQRLQRMLWPNTNQLSRTTSFFKWFFKKNWNWSLFYVKTLRYLLLLTKQKYPSFQMMSKFWLILLLFPFTCGYIPLQIDFFRHFILSLSSSNFHHYM